MTLSEHQYIERKTATVRTEKLFRDQWVNFLYSDIRENAQWLFHILTSARISQALGWLNYDVPFGLTGKSIQSLVYDLDIDTSECLDDIHHQKNPRNIFERKIRYWETRPMPEGEHAIVSPADARVLVGSLNEWSQLNIKNKFFDFKELLGYGQTRWLDAFSMGEVALFRLTPDKYHYNHVPVSGCVLDFYHIHGRYHSCNPSAVVPLVTPFSKNRRTVTVIDTDVEGGTGIGLVAMIEIVALMIGDIVQCYSEQGYESPRPMTRSLFLKKGQPKSLFRPGSSTIVLLFQPKRIQFSADLVRNMYLTNVRSRFSKGFGIPLVETEVDVRSPIALSTR